MFSKILIANRGEIVCRIIRTVRRMGISAVAVYSEADEASPHVRQADEAMAIGAAPAADSYLSIDRILQAARRCGVDAVHPGYGFLAENAAFAEAVTVAGLVFIGPPARAIAAMGDKLEAKRLAAAAGVDTLEGTDKPVRDAGQALRRARTIGYPVMLKAAAGGGGKGMRVVRGASSLRREFALARDESRGAFADDRVFIEKYLDEPRHIEIQIVADDHGNVIHLGERECSIQRRHQKVIEEAPSPHLDDATRQAMTAQAVALARAVDYRSAGTVEFLIDSERRFHFLEMNTRLQVEHPVTEWITGLDLVELMVRIAAGERLPVAQADVRFDGWAIEARVYAEDPARDFMPSMGRITRYIEPVDVESARVDSGVEAGSEVTRHYDPLLAKISAHGAERSQAIARLAACLDRCHVGGIRTNLTFLAAAIARDRFAEGRLSTQFIEQEFAGGTAPSPVEGELLASLAAVAAIVHRRSRDRDFATGGQIDGRPALATRFIVRAGGTDFALIIDRGDQNQAVTFADGNILTVRSAWRPGELFFHGVVGSRPICVQVELVRSQYRLRHSGMEVEASVLTPRVAALRDLMPRKPLPDRSKYLQSPMPGLLIAVSVAVGQSIKAGDVVAVVEAMKMQNVLRAPRDGTVRAVLVKPGSSLAAGQVIIELV